MLYQNRLLRVYNSHTLDLVQLFYLLFPKSRVYQSTYNLSMWKHIDVTLENENLVCREPKPSLESAYWQNYNANHPLPNKSFKKRPYPCNRYNAGCNCRKFKYQHICIICQKNHHAKSSNKGPNANKGRYPNCIPTCQKKWLENPFHYITGLFPYPLVNKSEILDQADRFD